MPSCSGCSKPIAISTRSASSTNSLPGTGVRSREETAGHLARVDVADGPVAAAEAGHLGAPAALAALVQGIGGRGPLGRQRPRMPGIARSAGQLGVDVEHDHAAGLLAVRVGDAVHARVAAADDDHPLAPGAQLAPGLGRSRGPALLRGDPAVALVEVVHRRVDPGQLASGNVEVTRDPRADRDHHRVEALLQLLGGDVAPDVGVVLELDPLLLEDRHAAVDDRLLELGVGHAEAQQAARALVALVHGHRVAAAVELGGRPPGRPGRSRRPRPSCPTADPAARRRSTPRRTRARRSPARSARSSPGRR